MFSDYKKALIILMIFMVFSLFSGVAHAGDSFRCGNRMAIVGDTILEVLQNCGEPTLKEVSGFTNRRYYGIHSGLVEDENFSEEGYYEEEYVKVEKWYFNCGRNRFIHILTFRNGILWNVRQGGRGSGSYSDSDCVGAGYRK